MSAPPDTVLLEPAIRLEEAAAALRIPPSTLRKWAPAGVVPAYKPGRQWVFLPSEIAAYREASAPKHRSVDASRNCASIRDRASRGRQNAGRPIQTMQIHRKHELAEAPPHILSLA